MELYSKNVTTYNKKWSVILSLWTQFDKYVDWRATGYREQIFLQLIKIKSWWFILRVLWQSFKNLEGESHWTLSVTFWGVFGCKIKSHKIPQWLLCNKLSLKNINDFVKLSLDHKDWQYLPNKTDWILRCVIFINFIAQYLHFDLCLKPILYSNNTLKKSSLKCIFGDSF